MNSSALCDADPAYVFTFWVEVVLLAVVYVLVILTTAREQMGM